MLYLGIKNMKIFFTISVITGLLIFSPSLTVSAHVGPHDNGMFQVSSTSGVSERPRMVVSGDFIYTVWEDNTPGNNDIFFRASLDDAVSWNPVINLSNDSGDSIRPYISASGQNVYVVWFDNSLGNYEILFRASWDGGASWGDIINLSNSSTPSIYGRIATANGTVYVAWQEDPPPNVDCDCNSEIYFTKSTDLGNTFSETINVSNDPVGSGVPILGVTNSVGDYGDEGIGNDVYLVWTKFISIDSLQVQTPENRKSIRMAYYVPTEKNWSNFNSFSFYFKGQNTGVTYYLSIQTGSVYDDNSLWYSWIDDSNDWKEVNLTLNNPHRQYGEPNLSEIQFFEIGSKQRTPSLDFSIDSIKIGNGPNQILLEDGFAKDWHNYYIPDNVIITSGYDKNARLDEKYRDYTTDILFRASMDNGDTFGNVINLSNNPGLSVTPWLSVHNEHVYVTWRDDEPGNLDIYFRASLNKGQTFEPVTNISNNLGASAYPYSATDKYNVYVVWWDETPSNYINSFEQDREILFAASHDLGKTWDKSINLSETLEKSSYPNMIAHKDNVYVTWHDQQDGDFDVYFTKSLDGGKNFAEPRSLQESNGNTSLWYVPQMTIEGNHLYVLWSMEVNGVWQICFIKLTEGSILKNTFTLNENASTTTSVGGHRQQKDIALNISGNYDCDNNNLFSVIDGTLTGTFSVSDGQIINLSNIDLRYSNGAIKIIAEPETGGSLTASLVFSNPMDCKTPTNIIADNGKNTLKTYLGTDRYIASMVTTSGSLIFE